MTLILRFNKKSLNKFAENGHFDDKNLQCEYIKCQLQTETISFSQTKSKKQKETEKNVRKRAKHIIKGFKY